LTSSHTFLNRGLKINNRRAKVSPIDLLKRLKGILLS
jgi:hypothetical protein